MLRQQVLHGYVLHSRPYRERSRIVQFYSVEYGRIDGVIRQSAPMLYQASTVMVSGKSGLKNFSQLSYTDQLTTLNGTSLFAGFYLNELLVKLLPLEEQNTSIFGAYSIALEQLASIQIDHQQTPHALIKILRQFEATLLVELGYGVSFETDALDCPILENQYYQYIHGKGFMLNHLEKGEHGKIIQLMQHEKTAFTTETLPMLTRVFKACIAERLDYKPLRSRELWIASQPPKSEMTDKGQYTDPISQS